MIVGNRCSKQEVPLGFFVAPVVWVYARLKKRTGTSAQAEEFSV